MLSICLRLESIRLQPSRRKPKKMGHLYLKFEELNEDDLTVNDYLQGHYNSEEW